MISTPEIKDLQAPDTSKETAIILEIIHSVSKILYFYVNVYQWNPHRKIFKEKHIIDVISHLGTLL